MARIARIVARGFARHIIQRFGAEVYLESNPFTAGFVGANGIRPLAVEQRYCADAIA